MRHRAPATQIVLIQVLGLLTLATAADHLTGADITASAFYIFPVALAGWRLGFAAGAATALGSLLVNTLSEWYLPGRTGDPVLLVANELLRLVVLLAVAGLAVMLSRQQRTVTAQRDELERLYSRLQSELKDAHAIQQIAAGAIPAHPSLDLRVHLRPARFLCGDTTYLALSREGMLAIAVADVCGKGSAAALAGAVLVGLMEDAPHRYESPAATLTHLNRRLEGYLPEAMFVTVFYGLLDTRTGCLRYASAGHEQPVILRAGGPGQAIPCSGVPLGVLPEPVFEEGEERLAPGDALVGFTDGVADYVLPTGRRFSLEELHSALAAAAGRSSAEIERAALAHVDPGREPDDDITLVIARYLGPPSPAGSPARE